jgi:hypothetical protein
MPTQENAWFQSTVRFAENAKGGLRRGRSDFGYLPGITGKFFPTGSAAMGWRPLL